MKYDIFYCGENKGYLKIFLLIHNYGIDINVSEKAKLFFKMYLD